MIQLENELSTRIYYSQEKQIFAYIQCTSLVNFDFRIKPVVSIPFHHCGVWLCLTGLACMSQRKTALVLGFSLPRLRTAAAAILILSEIATSPQPLCILLILRILLKCNNLSTLQCRCSASYMKKNPGIIITY